MLPPKQPVINAVLIIYTDYSITENYRVAQKECFSFWLMSIGPHAHQIYLPAISFFGGYLKSKVYVRKPRTV